MKSLVIKVMARAAGACLVLSLAPFAIGPAAAQQSGSHASAGSHAGPQASAIPRMDDGHPDLSGVWWGGSDVGGRGFLRSAQRRSPDSSKPETFASLYQPWAAKHAAQLTDKDDPSLKCIPTAFGTLNVRLWDVGAVGQIVATPKFVVLLTETYHGFQIVPTDGRHHRDVVPPSHRGDAVGHWEGDTFVIETTNFTDDTWMSAEGRVSFHSDALSIVERYRRTDAKTLVIDATVDDPKVLTKPWKVPTQTLTLAPFDQIIPLDCVGTETEALIDAAQASK
ncbi:MAG TPA: hypothetical protein VFY39_12895 [Gammaproteobacteria bacterium]|nr:hypothetical protein [Gammaproteobacteria bacterium]